MTDARLERLASFFLEPSRSTFEPNPEPTSSLATSSSSEPVSIERSAPTVTSSCLVDGRLASSNAWKWKVQHMDPSLLNIENLHIAMNNLNSSPGAHFDLRLPASRLASGVLGHCTKVLRMIASRDTVFAVGITVDPYHRFCNASYGYLGKGVYDYMTVIAITRTMEAAGYLEAALIRDAVAFAGCQNRAPGGEGINPDSSPGFVYIVSHRG